LAGNRDVQAEGGLGIRFGNNFGDFKPLLAAGVQAPYVNGGLNFVYGTPMPELYAGVNTLAKTKAPRWVNTGDGGGSLSCAHLPGGNWQLEQVNNGTIRRLSDSR